MRILILGNMANDGYAVAKGLWAKNVDADLAVNVSDFGMALPEWEDGDIQDNNIDPYNIKREQIENTFNARSNRIHYFDFLNKIKSKRAVFAKIKTRLDLIRMMRKYDVVEAHVPYPIYTQFSGVPYITYDAGWIRYLPYDTTLKGKLARRGYSKGKGLIMTNPDTFEISDRLSYLDKKKIYFSPFAIDPNKYRPIPNDGLRSKFVKKEKDDELLLFCPARQMWKEKGNDKMISAFSKFVKVFPNSKFIMVSWSLDESKSKKLVEDLGISNNVIWINPVPKNQLIQYYNIADIVLDQFVLGSWGTSTPEAMCCGKPVLIFYKREYILRAFGEEPPILNSFTEDEIFSNLVKLGENVDFRKEMGKKSRDWIIKTHSPDVVSKIHLDIIESSLAK
jgi:glycosyltransferase involved in cell wall biosynthesis